MRRRVLVVEDNAANMELFTTLLEGAGFEALEAASAEVGLDLARSETPDLIIMDIGLPGMDGLEATRILKADPETRTIPIVVTTSHAMAGDRETAFAAGCDGYITKPIDTRSYVDSVASFIGEERVHHG